MSFDTIGEGLHALGYTGSVIKGETLSSPLVRGAGFRPQETSSETARYGWPKGVKQGSLAGERALWHHKILDVAMHPSNPLNITDQAAVKARWGQSQFWDGVDPLYVCKPGASACAFDAYFVPVYRQLFGADEGEKPAEPKPTPKPPPTPVPQPQPGPAPTPQTSVDQRVAELVELLSQDIGGIPAAQLRNAALRLARGRFVALALRRAVEMYRGRQ